MIGWLIYSEADAERNRTYIDWLVSGALENGFELKLLYTEDIVIGIRNGVNILYDQGKELSKPAFVIMRSISQILSSHFEEMGIRTFNNLAISTMANHKFLTHQKLSNLGIPMLDTFYYKKNTMIKSFDTVQFPCVLKNCTGRGGNEVYFINNQEELLEIVQNSNFDELLIQNVAEQLGKDLRVFIIGKEIVAAVLRYSEKDFRANFSLGGGAMLYELSQNEKEIIQKIVDHFDFDFVGIDFMFDANNQLILNEIEDVVGSRTLYTVSNIDIVSLYMDYIKKQINC
ncbi:ATP-grasp domain-containing protein [Gottfriedia acidiceleris]|uniref:RimK family alpha-L-glutamate ligase n=1 Tax=Gottfriedia acidiceleris TaxID=371036 RepID=A0ABY4JLB1_9BACI|nr:RimK family alpha-L-glutamate ligase [Gottfriedia acidiceleris]UPM54246.1 RimK family alpha-L-glutamate ligase [Gottfriedia acidiceleris]